MKHQTYLTKTAGKLRSVFLLLLVVVFSLSGMVTANAATIGETGEYALVLQAPDDEWEGCFDGEYAIIVRFNVAQGETTVKLSELTAGIVPFNGKTEFSHWVNRNGERVGEDLSLQDFTSSGNFYTSTGDEVTYTRGLNLTAAFSDKRLDDTGNYYVTLDAFGGTIGGKAKLLLQGPASAFQTIDLNQYTPVRKGCTFVGWDLGGKLVTALDASAFANGAVAELTATYIQDAFDGGSLVLKLNANGGTIDGKAVGQYDYLGGGNSGTAMSLLPYVPVRNGYTFAGWNTKQDGSGNNYKYVYWRTWDNNEETNKEFDKDTLITETNGYVRYKNVTLYATWTKNPGHTHTYEEKKTLTRATTTKDGKRTATYICTGCKATYTKTLQTYYKVNNIKLNKTAYTYNGKVQKPSVTVKDSKGKALKNGTDYKISYPKGMKNVGKYTVKVTLKGNYSGSKSMTYNINPKGTGVSKVKAAKKGFKVTWKKQATQTTGYQVQYSTSSKFKKAKTVTISKNKTTSKSVSKLSAKKKYYVRVRTYKTVKIGGKSVKLYSGWSKAKSVTTKK